MGPEHLHLSQFQSDVAGAAPGTTLLRTTGLTHTLRYLDKDL